MEMKVYILYPIEAKNEEEKEEKTHYIYVCRKQSQEESMEAAKHFESVCAEIIKEAEEDPKRISRRKMGGVSLRSLS